MSSLTLVGLSVSLFSMLESGIVGEGGGGTTVLGALGVGLETDTVLGWGSAPAF